MKPPRIVTAMEKLEDGLILEAAEETIEKKHPWKRIAAAAACLCLVIGGIQIIRHGGGSSGTGGRSHTDGDIPYMEYAGPVLPLTAQSGGEGLTVFRHVNYDFSPYHPTQQGKDARWSAESVVTDRYVLTNETDTDQKLTLYYPFVGTMRDWEQYPVVTVNDVETETTLYPGPYPADNHNHLPLNSFAGYNALLEDGEYLEAAIDPFPDLNVPAIVYQLHDYRYTQDADAANPTLMMEFTIDPEKTKVFSYGMNIGSWENETGRCGRGTSAIEKKKTTNKEPEPAYVILIGEDIEHYTVQGYRDGGCEAGEELRDLSCTVTRYETTLSEVVRPLMKHYLGEFLNQKQAMETPSSGMPPMELYDGLTAELLCSHGAVSQFPTDRYDMGMLEHIFSIVFTEDRVLYQSWQTTVPAGGEAVVEVSLRKQASRDFVGKHQNRNGYDLATKLGSSLCFADQRASVSNYDSIEIVGQNFGFDLRNGITDVRLDPEFPHYWMEIQPISAKK